MLSRSNKITGIFMNKSLVIGLFVSLAFIGLSCFLLFSENSLAFYFPKENALPSPTPTIEVQLSEYPPLNPTATVQNSLSETLDIESAMLILEENGFVGNEINFSSGKNILVIQNKTLWTVKLYIKNSSGEIEKEIQINAAPEVWKGIIDLPSGEHNLIGAEQSQFICRININ